MPNRTIASALIVMALLAVPARASRYAYSFAFSGGTVATASGTFAGTLNGDLIENISEITLFLDGVQAAGTIQTASFSPSYLLTTGATASFDVTKNNFVFVNDDPFAPAPNALFFWIANYESVGGQLDGGLGYSTNVTPDQWTLTEIPENPAVPETAAAWPLLLTVLAGLGWLRRRV